MKEGKVANFRKIPSLSIRFSREVYGIGERVIPRLRSEKGIHNTLIFSPLCVRWNRNSGDASGCGRREGRALWDVPREGAKRCGKPHRYFGWLPKGAWDADAPAKYESGSTGSRRNYRGRGCGGNGRSGWLWGFTFSHRPWGHSGRCDPASFIQNPN